MSAVVCAIALVAGGCRAIPGASLPGGTPEVSAQSTPGVTTSLAICDEVPSIEAPADWYRDEPIYVMNEQPESEIHRWAKSQPGFEAIWIDRDHLGWITLAFTQDAAQRQAELERLFPDAGVVAVEVDWTMAELERLQARISDALHGAGIQAGSGILQQRGVVTVDLAYLYPDDLAFIEREFGDERICVSGRHPSLAPAPGPQQWSGDGWILLAAERDAGRSYHVEVATEPGAFAALWSDIGLAGDAPAVDFGTHVVIWFGAVYGSSCPELRLDGVVADDAADVLYPEIVLASDDVFCTSDANPFAFVVAAERSTLPAPPFAVQLGPDVQPGVHPEYRKIVEVDLRQPGAVAGPGDIHADDSPDEPYLLESGAIMEAGYEAAYRFSVHCGIEWLGEINGLAWRTDVPADAPDFVPPEWAPAVKADGMLEVVLLMQIEPEPTITATAAGHSVTYRAVPGDPPGCD